MTKHIENILLQMYNVNSIDRIPNKVIDAVKDANYLCKMAGGELISRQIIANIIIQFDDWKCYSPNSEDFIGEIK